MARKPRIHYPGAFYHVILRGNAGDPIFFDDQDRYRLYLILQYAVEKFRCRIHAFCLMRNHLHLVMEVDDVPLSRIMQNISLRYTKWINFSQSRTGHLFQGRYKALLIDADTYLLELVRYVHLNPVRAGASSSPEAYAWSGHHTYLGTELLPWLTTGFVLGMLSPRIKTARKSYAAFAWEGLTEGKRQEFHSGTCQGRILGGEDFADQVLIKTRQKGERQFTLTEVVNAVCDQFQITEESLKAPGKMRPITEARAIAAAIVQSASHLRLTDFGKLVGRDVSALGKAVQRVMSDESRVKIVQELMAGLQSM